jgi:Na+/H+ antiporter NhaD/arsenite permease-like protein
LTGNITLIFSLLFALILIILVTGRYHRAVAALLGAFLTILFSMEYNLFMGPNVLNDIIGFIDVNTVFLVIGIMILVEAVTRTGFFEFIGLSIAKTVGGGFRRISLAFILLTILFSAVLSNITTMIIIGALTVSLAKKFRFDPTNVIIYEILMSNVGGLALLISSIPNLILAGQLKISFTEFLAISLPLTLILSAVSMLFISRWTKKEFGGERPLEVDVAPWSVVENRSLFYRAASVFIIVIVLFIFESNINIPIGLIAMGGAIAVLVVGGQEPEAIFSGVDWGTVFFLTSFYVVVGGLQASGVITSFADGVVQVLSFNPHIAPVLNVWASGLPSAIIDNIPMTLTLIPVMQHVSAATGYPLRILGWAIVFGANLGGNLTPIGSASNIIGLGILRKEGKLIGWSEWFRRVGPFSILLMIISTVYVVFLSVMLS